MRHNNLFCCRINENSGNNDRGQYGDRHKAKRINEPFWQTACHPPGQHDKPCAKGKYTSHHHHQPDHRGLGFLSVGVFLLV